MSKTFIVTREKLAESAEYLLKEIITKVEESGSFVALYGDLGAGKTAFVKEAAKLLGVEEEIISPTFILKKEYETPVAEVEKLIHVDAYRFDDPKEGDALFLDRDVLPKTLVFIEWPQKIARRKYDAEIHFEYKGEDKREVAITIHEKRK